MLTNCFLYGETSNEILTSLLSSQTPNPHLEKIVEDYERDGYVIIPGVLNKSEVNALQAQWNYLRKPLKDGKVIDGIKRDNFYIHGKLPAPLGDVYKNPTIVNICKRLLGPDVALYLNRINIKDSTLTSPIHLHQDMPYFNGKTDKINFFVAVVDIDESNGGMLFVPKSHNLGLLDRKTIELDKYPELETVIPSLKAGDLLIADIRLWHSSAPNTVGTDRVLLQMMLQPADDGSFYTPNLSEPVLVTGNWKTDYFEAWKPNPPVAQTATAKIQDDSFKNRIISYIKSYIPQSVKEWLRS